MVTLQIVPYTQIANMSGVGRIRYLLNIAKSDKIVLLQGRLRKQEEAELIRATMEEINKDFKGIELAVINPGQAAQDSFQKLKYDLIDFFFGAAQGLTVIGPSTIVKSIKKDPSKIELLTRESKTKKSRRRRKR